MQKLSWSCFIETAYFEGPGPLSISPMLSVSGYDLVLCCVRIGVFVPRPRVPSVGTASACLSEERLCDNNFPFGRNPCGL